MESTANLMIFYEIRRKLYKFHGKQQYAMANLETGGLMQDDWMKDLSNCITVDLTKCNIGGLW